MNETGMEMLRKKYNEAIAEIIMSEIPELPETMRKPTLDKIIECLINDEDDVYSEKPAN